MELILGLIAGFGGGVALVYFLTAPEYRPALFSSLRTEMNQLHDKIATAIEKARHKDGA